MNGLEMKATGLWEDIPPEPLEGETSLQTTMACTTDYPHRHSASVYPGNVKGHIKQNKKKNTLAVILIRSCVSFVSRTIFSGTKTHLFLKLISPLMTTVRRGFYFSFFFFSSSSWLTILTSLWLQFRVWISSVGSCD